MNGKEYVSVLKATTDKVETLNPRLMTTMEVKDWFANVAKALRSCADGQESRDTALANLENIMAHQKAKIADLSRRLEELRNGK